MSKQILARYGPGLLYGRNTIMSYLDDLTRVDSQAVERLAPAVGNQSKGKRTILIDELRELEDIRSNLKSSFTDTLELAPPQFPKIVEQILPKIEAPFQILSEVIIPIIEQISFKTPESIPKFLSTMNQFLTANAPTEVWDVPKVSEKITQWMKQALILPNCDKVSILQFWLKFIKLRAKIEDVLVLASVWFEHHVSEDQLSLFQLLISDVKLEMAKCTFIDFIESPSSPINVSYYPIMSLNMKQPQSFAEQPKRKCAAHRGFLYVIDSALGFSKLGTGYFGTIFGQTELTTNEFINQIPVSMGVCNNKILVRFADKQSNDITIIDPSTLKAIGTVQTEQPLPSGPFTAFKDTIYIVSQKSLFTYSFDGTTMKKVKCSDIQVPNGEAEFIPAAKLEYANLFTDGIMLNVVYTSKDESPAAVVSCNIESCDVIDIPSGTDPKMCPFAAFDSEAQILIFAPSWSPASIYKYSERYSLQTLFGEIIENTGNPCLDLLNAIIPSAISKISPGTLNYNRHYVLVNTKPLYDLIQLGFSDERYSVFLEKSIILLTIFISQVNKDLEITFDLVLKIVKSEKISSVAKIELLKALIKHGNSYLFDTVGKCSQIIENLSNNEITKLFTFGFNDIFLFALLFLTKPFDSVLEFAAINSASEYPFLSNLIFTTLRGIFIKKCFPVTFSLPILVRIPKCAKSSLITIVPPLIPLIGKLLELPECELYTNIILDLAMNLIQYTSISDLQKFAEFHASVRDQPQYVIQTKVDETPHPYDNEMNYYHHYDFPGAVEITVEFDKQTNTEPNCDYLQIFSDVEMKKELSPKMSGRYSKWTTVIKTNSQHLTFHFYSDGSVTEWGYKATITARFVATRSFCSPDSFFDLSFAVSEMLYAFAKRLNNQSHIDYHYPKFEISKEVLTTKISDEKKNEIKEKLKNQIDVSILDQPTFLESSFSVLAYMVDNNMFDKSLLEMIMAPPEFMILATQDTKRIFQLLASFIMSNNFSELPESRFNFLIEAIKGTADALKFAQSSLSKADEGLNNSDPEKLMRAASYIQTAFRISGENIVKEGRNAISNFLRALSVTSLPLNSPLASSLIEKSHHLFKTVLPSLPDVFQFLETICESLETMEINRNDKTIPFIGFALSVALILPNEVRSQSFFRKLALNSLRFNIPSNISLISQIVEKFNVHTNMNESPIIADILRVIGEGFTNQRPNPTTTETANISPMFSISRAAILRRLIEPETISDLAPIIESQTKASLGALLVLSQRYLPPHTSQKVRLLSNNKIVTLIGADYHNYHFRTDKGNVFTLPSMNTLTFNYLPVPFEPLFPSELPTASSELIKAVEKCIGGENDRFAKLALAELSVSTEVKPTSDAIIAQTTSSAESPLTKSAPQKLKIVEDKGSFFKLKHAQKLYRLNKDSLTVSFRAQASMVVGFGAKNRMTSTEITPITITNNHLLFDLANNFSLTFESSEFTIGLIGPLKQVFIQTGTIFVLTQLYLGAIVEPQPYFLAEEVPELIVPKNFPSFLFYAKKCRQFSHGYSNLRLYSIVNDLNHPIKMQSIHFLPAVHKEAAKFIYLEISTLSKNVTFCLLNDTIEAHVLYQSSLNDLPEKQTKTVGIYVSLENVGFAFMTIEGKYVESSAARITVTDSVSLFLSISDTEFVSVNNGLKPFVFDYNDFLANKLAINDLPTREPFIVAKKVPIGLSSLVTGAKSVADFMASPKKFRAEPFERPIYIPSRNIVTSFVPVDHIAAIHSVDVVSDFVAKLQLNTDKIISLTESLVMKKPQFISAIQRMQTTLPEFISPFLFCESNQRDEERRNLLTKAKRDSFFERLEKEASFAITANEFARNYQVAIRETNIDLEKFVVNSANAFQTSRILSGEYNPIFGRLLRAIFDNDRTLFEKLASKALGYLTGEIPLAVANGSKADFFSSSVVLVSNQAKVEVVEIQRTGADCIHIRVLPSSAFANDIGPSIKAIGNNGTKAIILPNSQELFEGGLFTLKNIKETDILYLKILPINFSKSPLAFSLQFINFMVASCNANDSSYVSEISEVLHSKVLFPLLLHCQKGNDVFFPSTYSLWYYRSIISQKVPLKLMEEYGESVCLKELAKVTPEISNSLSLFGLYCYANAAPNEFVVRERTVNFLDTMMSLLCSSREPPPFEGLLLRITTALISPYGNCLKFLGRIGELKLPVLTTASFVFSKNCRVPEKAITIDLMTQTVPAEPIIIEDERLTAVYFKLSKNIGEGYLYANDEPIKSSKLISTSGPVKIRTKPAETTVQVIPMRASQFPTVNDFVQLYSYYDELQKLSLEDDAILVSVAQALVSNHVTFASTLDDGLLSKLVPSISTDALRYRISCHMSSIHGDTGKLATYAYLPQLSAALCCLQFSLGAVSERSISMATFKDFDYGESDFISLLSKLQQWMTNIPATIRSKAPTLYTSINKADHDISFTKFLRSSTNNLFESRNGGMYVPKIEATDETSLSAFQGFGILIGLRFITGRSIPFPLSRVVLRIAFGGEVNEDDLKDSNFQFDELAHFDKQFEAIRIGVEFAMHMFPNMTTSTLFTRVLQIAPQCKNLILKNELTGCLVDPVVYPVVRRAAVYAQVMLQNDEKRKELLGEISKAIQSRFE